MVVVSSNNFILTLQGILNPDLSLTFGKMQVIKIMPDFRVSYYYVRTIAHIIVSNETRSVEGDLMIWAIP